METLTLENICHYLPYGLKLWSTLRNTPVDVVGFDKDSLLIQYLDRAKYHSMIGGFNPILRPMNLTKSIVVDGKEIIPIVELAKIAFPELQWFLFAGNCRAKTEDSLVSVDFGYNKEAFAFWCHRVRMITVKNQLALFKKLYEWKMDADGLIGLGLAIDADTLPVNPYNS